jgi:hypothetical protein
MPANLTPEYRKAEQAYRAAREPRERLACLREMLRAIPKHKGTEHLQGDIKARIKELTEELAGPRKGGARSGPGFAVRREGAAQVALLGPPNAGKSSLHARLTGSRAEVARYPYATKVPMPGMLPYRDVHFQLVDLPPISREYLEPWLPATLSSSDAALLVVDLADPECVEHVAAIRERLAVKKVVLAERWPGLPARGPTAGEPPEGPEGEAGEDPFRIALPTLLVANKRDLDPDPEEVDVLEELLGARFPAVSVSAKTGEGLERIGALLFEGLEILRVYTKVPGKPPDLQRPFTVRRGATVHDVARLVHNDLARSLSFARVWGRSGHFEGQQVGADHPVADGDVVELHD